jgi:hypothetical protein
VRRLLVTVTAVLALTVAPTTAHALPAPDLCTPDVTRGGVPADFVMDACVDATSITLRNDLGHPVLVHGTGDVGAPARVHERGSAAASVLRLLSGVDELLMPGDVTRWPLGAAPAAVVVVDVDPVTRSVVDSLTTRLPELGTGDAKEAGAVATVVREVIAALHDRTTCSGGKNFLGRASCDVDAAARISRALSAQFPRSTAVGLLPIALDPARWTAWSEPATPALPDAGPRSAGVAGRILTLAAVPPPVVTPPVVVPPPVVAAPPVPTRPRVPAPAAPPVAPPVAAAGVPAPAPTANHSVSDWRAAVLQQLAARRAAEGSGHGSHKGHG